MKAATTLLVALSVLLAGCVSDEQGDASPNDDAVVVTAPTATLFPEWSGVDHTNQTLNASAFDNTTYMAYFSAPWCAHCESTLDAYDSVIPEGRIVIFSMEAREEYANMSTWHNQTETGLNRTVNRPFILHPELAKSVEVKSIPHAVLVNAQGYVFHVEIGKETNLTTIQTMWETASAATFDPTSGWNQTLAAEET